jgi:hypothetical protein
MSRIVFGIVFALFSGSIMAIEEPRFDLLEKTEPYELRAYKPRIVAETIIPGSLKNASSAGFKRIADYIFGNNASRSGESQKISMTAPVSMVPKSEKISMTAPVNMEQSEGQWRMQFFMPSQYTMDNLPKPNNPAVTLRTLPASTFAVLRFSGLAGEEKTADKTADLLAWLKGKGIKPTGEPVLARYNPPWTLPFLRRNEVMVAY